MRMWSAHAAGNPNDRGWSAEHAHAADRFARDHRYFGSFAVRLRRLMGNSLARAIESPTK
jgi:hypothetical protein